MDLLTRDIARHPEHVQTLETNLMQRLRSIPGGNEADLAAPLPPDDRADLVKNDTAQVEGDAVQQPAQSLKGMFGKPTQSVAIEDMNAAIAEKGAAATPPRSELPSRREDRASGLCASRVDRDRPPQAA